MQKLTGTIVATSIGSNGSVPYAEITIRVPVNPAKREKSLHENGAAKPAAIRALKGTVATLESAK